MWSMRKTNEEFQNELKQLRECGHDVYSDDIYVNNKTPMQFYCSKNHRWPSIPTNILHGHECPYCAGYKVWRGFNDLWTTHSNIARLLKNPEYGYLYSYGSEKVLEFICPLCGNIIVKSIKDVVSNGLFCYKCADTGISYPNKFGRAFLSQLPIDDYTPEYSPDWLKPYSYDNYFKYNNQEYILEMDGGIGHGNKKFKSKENDVDGAKRDQIKDTRAYERGFIVIRIDAKESNCEYIKNNILHSCLNDIFDLSAIDWLQCDMQAQKNLVREACTLYELGNSTSEIAKLLHMNRTTILNYVVRGSKLGWCNYDGTEAKMKSIKKNSHPLIVIHKESGATYYFDSVKACVRELPRLCNKKIIESCVRNAYKTGVVYKGFIFNLANNTIQN